MKAAQKRVIVYSGVLFISIIAAITSFADGAQKAFELLTCGYYGGLSRRSPSG